jgi:hypothetical protein
MDQFGHLQRGVKYQNPATVVLCENIGLERQPEFTMPAMSPGHPIRAKSRRHPSKWQAA